MAGVTTTHPQARVLLGGLDVEVDAVLVPVLIELWRRDFETTHSCQGRGHIAFLSAPDGVGTSDVPTQWYESAWIVFAHDYWRREHEIYEALQQYGWVVIDVFSWAAPGMPVRTVARFARPGTVL